LALEIRVRGRVQGVLIRASGPAISMASFVERLERESPPLARVDTIETKAVPGDFGGDFRIVASVPGAARTEVAPDAAVCPACAAEIVSPTERRYR
jgi:hydrogenase maturation protein HypF